MDLLAVIFAALLSLGSAPSAHGPLSVYWPGDGFNAGRLACGDKVFTRSQVHVAVRNWRALGCGRLVLVRSTVTGKAVLAPVMDSGPWGAYRGKLRHAVRDGRWKVFAGATKLPQGWKWRAAVDLSYGLWQALGKPPGLSHVDLVVLPQPGRRLLPRSHVSDRLLLTQR